MKKLIVLTLFITVFLNAKPNSIGIGALKSSNIYINNDNETMILPIINYEKHNFYIKGLEFGYKYNQFLSLLIEPRLNEVEIDGIKNRKRTVEAGFKLSYPIKKYKLTLKVLADTLGVHNGYKSKLSLSYSFIKMPFIFIPNIALEYNDSNINNHYFGINKNESFDYYDMKSSINKQIGFVSIFALTRNYSLNLIYNYKKFDKNTTKSPIVIEDNKQVTILSLMYKF